MCFVLEKRHARPTSSLPPPSARWLHAPRGAVRFGFGATQQTQALWICAEHEERGESFRFRRFLGATSAFYLGRSRVYLPVSILPSEINRDVSSVAVHYFHFASVLFTFRRYLQRLGSSRAAETIANGAPHGARAAHGVVWGFGPVPPMWAKSLPMAAFVRVAVGADAGAPTAELCAAAAARGATGFAEAAGVLAAGAGAASARQARYCRSALPQLHGSSPTRSHAFASRR